MLAIGADFTLWISWLLSRGLGLIALAWVVGCSDPASPVASSGGAGGDAVTDGPGDAEVNPWADSVSLGQACTSDQACADQQDPAGSCHQWQCLSGSCQLGQAPAGSACVGSAKCLVFACDDAGSCSAVAAVSCPGAACAAGVCNQANGICELAPVAAGLPCTDGNPCTLADACSGTGNCIGSGEKVCSGTTCAPQHCVAQSGACAVTAAVSGTACEDGNPCTAADACDGKGECAPGIPQDCGQGPCWSGGCDPGTGGCVQLAKPPTTPCDDGVACTLGDSCSEGNCKAGVWSCACKVDSDCADGSPCTADACAAGSCLQAPLSGGACSDGSACTTGDACLNGLCLPGTATLCDDDNACTADACVTITGACAFGALSELACSDGNPCTQADACFAGQCNSGPAKVCASKPPCQSSFCDDQTGACAAVDLAGPCTGTNGCIVGQNCLGGLCAGGTAVVCDDGNPCTEEDCEPATGLCSSALQPDGTACGTYRSCGAGACTCVLGAFALPSTATETARGVQPTALGFVVAGQSLGPGGTKGLVAHISLTNQPIWQHRYASSSGAALEFAAVATFGPGYQVAASLPGDRVGSACCQAPPPTPPDVRVRIRRFVSIRQHFHPIRSSRGKPSFSQ